MFSACFTKRGVQNYTAGTDLQLCGTLYIECAHACQLLHVTDEIGLRHIKEVRRKKETQI